MPTGAELFVQTAKALEIGEIFTLVGDHLNEVLAVAAREGIRIVDMRHESGVTHAADAWARIHRRPALSLVTGGPGHTNSLTGIATAQLAGSPLIAVSGSRPNATSGRGAFQDIEQAAMAAPVCKWSAEVPSAARIPFYLGRACSEANSGRKGVAHLSIPSDVFIGKADSAASAPLLPEIRRMPDSRDVDAAIAAISRAQRPIAIAGSGVWWSGAHRELRAFIARTGLPLYTVTMAKGSVADDDPLCFGYADPALNVAARTAFKEADLVVVIGKRIDYRLALGGSRLFSPEARFVQIDIHEPELGLNRRLEAGICSDARLALTALEGSAKALSLDSWKTHLLELRAAWQGDLEAIASDRSAPLHPAAFFQELRKGLPADTLFSWDGGDFTHWGRAGTPARIPGGWLRLGPLGTIGSALPNSVAMQLAHPGKPVVMITGDGSLGFYLAELDTLVRYKLPVVIIVGNDGGWGIERELQKAADSGPTVACELRRTRYDQIMQGFGGGGELIESLDQVRPALDRALASGVPYLLNVQVRGARSPFTDWQIAAKK